MKYTEINEQYEIDMNNLYKTSLVFFAFDKKQFAENKTQLKENEKYVSIGHGGYIPRSKLATLRESEDNLSKNFRNNITLHGVEKQEILYQINNHEIFYTGRINDMYEYFQDIHTKELIDTVFKENINVWKEINGY